MFICWLGLRMDGRALGGADKAHLYNFKDNQKESRPQLQRQKMELVNHLLRWEKTALEKSKLDQKENSIDHKMSPVTFVHKNLSTILICV